MVRKIFVTAVAGMLAGGCASMSQTSPSDAAYRKLADDYVTGYLAWRPQEGTSLGLHQYDGKVTDLNRASLDAEHARLVHYRDALAAIDDKTLSPRLSRERRMIVASIQNELQSDDDGHEYTHNPMTYSSVDLTTYAQRDFAPKPQRLRSVVAILNQTPAMTDAGKINLDEHLPKTFITTAIDQANGSADFIEDDLVKAFDDVKDPQLQTDFAAARKVAVPALRGYADWLKSSRLPTATDDFALGRAAYIRMLKCELLDQTPEEVLAIGLAHLKQEQKIFADAAARIDPTKSPAQIIAILERDHPSEKTLVSDTRQRLENIRQFVIARDLVTFPSQVPVMVAETPKFKRHASFAMMDAPGPFEKAAQAFYYVTPTEPDWDAKRKEEWLARFFYYDNDVTTIHEAYPGHYVQFLHLKASSATVPEKIFGSYAYIEGWAHYCEQMVIDEGYPDGADSLTRAKYRVAQSQDAILRLCRLCVSVQMHCQGMSVDQATKFFMDNCYYGEAPARAEAERGTFDPGYCFYTLGKLQFLKLREDYRRQEGANFSMKKFHDALLDHGEGPIRLLREVLLTDSSQWDKTL
jgi:uncharacterized protein (DUF885 family)